MKLSCAIILSLPSLSNGQLYYAFTDKVDTDDWKKNLNTVTSFGERMSRGGAGDPEFLEFANLLTAVQPGDKVSDHLIDLFERANDGMPWERMVQDGFIEKLCDGQERFDIFMCNSWMC